MPVVRNRPSITITPRKYNTEGLPKRFMNPGEIEVLLHLFEDSNARVLVEFGVNEGRNAAAALRNFPQLIRYVGVDVPPGYVTTMAVQRNEIPANPGHLAAGDERFTLIVRPRGTFELIARDFPLGVDAVFIDADHSKGAVLHDYWLARAIVRPGGTIVFHDDNGLPSVEVTQALNELCAEGAQIQHVAGTWLAFERIPSATAEKDAA